MDGEKKVRCRLIYVCSQVALWIEPLNPYVISLQVSSQKDVSAGMLECLCARQYGIVESQREEARAKFSWTYFASAAKGLIPMTLQLSIGGENVPPPRILTRPDLETLVGDCFFVPSDIPVEEKQEQYEETYAERLVKRKRRNMSEKEKAKERKEAEEEAKGKGKGKGKGKAAKKGGSQKEAKDLAVEVAEKEDAIKAKGQEAPPLADFSLYESVVKRIPTGEWEGNLDQLYAVDLPVISLHIQARNGSLPRVRKGGIAGVPQLSDIGEMLMLSSLPWERITAHGFGPMLKPLLHAALYEQQAIQVYRGDLVRQGAGKQVRELLADVLEQYTRPEFAKNKDGTETWFGWWDEKLLGNVVQGKASQEETNMVEGIALIMERQARAKTYQDIQSLVSGLERSPLSRVSLRSKAPMSWEVSLAITGLARVSSGQRLMRRT